MGAEVDPFWVPPEEFGPPRDLSEIAEALRDVTVVLGRVVRACHAVRPRVNMRPTVRELHRMWWRLLSIAETLIDAQQVLEDDAPLALDFPDSDQVPWWFRENPLLSPRQLLALHKLALPEGFDGVRNVGPLISYRKVLEHTEAEPHHIVDHRRRLEATIEKVLKDAEDLIHPARRTSVPGVRRHPTRRAAPRRVWRHGCTRRGSASPLQRQSKRLNENSPATATSGCRVAHKQHGDARVNQVGPKK